MTLEFEAVNGSPTFFAYGRVSDEAMQQCIDVYDALTPHHGITSEGVNKSKKDSMDVSIPPNGTLMIQEELEKFGMQYFEYFHLSSFSPSWNISELIQIQKYPRYYKKLKSKSRSIQLQNKMKHNPVDVSYPKSRIQRCRP